MFVALLVCIDSQSIDNSTHRIELLSVFFLPVICFIDTALTKPHRVTKGAASSLISAVLLPNSYFDSAKRHFVVSKICDKI